MNSGTTNKQAVVPIRIDAIQERLWAKGSAKEPSQSSYRPSPFPSPLTAQQLTFNTTDFIRPGIKGLLDRRPSARSLQSPPSYHKERPHRESVSRSFSAEPSFITPQSSAEFSARSYLSYTSHSREGAAPDKQSHALESSLESVVESFERGLGPPSVALSIKLRGNQAESFFSALAKSRTTQVLPLHALFHFT